MLNVCGPSAVGSGSQEEAGRLPTHRCLEAQPPLIFALGAELLNPAFRLSGAPQSQLPPGVQYRLTSACSVGALKFFPVTFHQGSINVRALCLQLCGWEPLHVTIFCTQHAAALPGRPGLHIPCVIAATTPATAQVLSRPWTRPVSVTFSKQSGTPLFGV